MTRCGWLMAAVLPWVGLAQRVIDPGEWGGSPDDTNRPPTLEIRVGPEARLEVRGDFYDPGRAPQVFTLEVSADLEDWRQEAFVLAAPFRWRNAAWAGVDRQYFRLRVTPHAEEHDWSNQYTGRGEPLLATNQAECNNRDRFGWVKFIVPLNDPTRVYFQHSHRYPLHYDFATRRLPEFQGLSPAAFNAITLQPAGQRAVLGTVLVPLDGVDWGVQFVGLEPYPREDVARWFERVREAVTPPAGGRLLYVPTFEQTPTARTHATWFAARGISVLPFEEWRTDRSACYTTGWAVGRLAFVPAPDIGAAYADGRLRPEDILLTDAVPAEIPYVAGILSLAPATPNSHVAILAESYGVPFAYIADPAERGRVARLAGHDVAVRTGAALGTCQVRVVDLGTSFDPGLKSALLALKGSGTIDLPARERFGAFSTPVDALVPADIRFVGGKAANYGLLRRTIPDHAPEAVAFSFDLWDAFLDQPLAGGGSLRQFIHEHLARHTYPPDLRALRADLEAVRTAITAVARFGPTERQAVLSALARFEPARKIRFRSSTNVEDSERFSGAGLYDSYSGCLADDLDGDDSGPCGCDAEERNERGVFRALQRVYASFYNENAFLERLRFRIDESRVGMAILAHYSTPDDVEEANGVATVDVQKLGGAWTLGGQLVTQAGAVSVANPAGAAQPEMVGFHVSTFDTNVWLTQASTLIPLGTRVLDWPSRYLELTALIRRVSEAYAEAAAPPGRLRLDLEYKQVAPGRLVIKQVREIPVAETATNAPAFLLRDDPIEFLVAGDVFAVHRLKSHWRLATGQGALGTPAAPVPLYGAIAAGFRGALGAGPFSGSPASWPAATENAEIVPGGGWAIHLGWRDRDADTSAQFELTTRLPRTVSGNECPWRTIRDANIECAVRYPTPVPAPGEGEDTVWRATESVTLFVHPWSASADTPPYYLQGSNRLAFSTVQRMANEYADRPATGVPPPCSAFGGGQQYSSVGITGETRVLGVGPEPLVLRSQRSQTLTVRGRTGHEHVEQFVCEPWLEPDLSAEAKAALTQANIRAFFFRRYQFGQRDERFLILGLDGRFRDASRP